MEFHKPKPVHNWRELLAEVGVVVIGVCIALAAEQTVEWWHWRSQVAEAREIIATEMAYSVEAAIVRIRTQPCMERRLDELARILDAAAKSGSLPPVGDISLPPRTSWRRGAWESIVASQTATHFPRQQLADISHAYKSIEMLEQTYNLETGDWHDLYAIVGPGRRLDPASEAGLRQALSRARSNSRAITILSGLMITYVKNLGLSFNADDIAGIANASHVSLTRTRLIFNGRNLTSTVCEPIGAVPATYGQGQNSDLLPLLGGMMKEIPDFSGGAR